MSTNYEALIPKGILFNIKEIEEMGAIKSEMMRKLIKKGNIEIVKIGNKTHVSRMELIRFLKENTLENSQ
ncbi:MULTISPECIES: helix-turn-helix domain-containing protein [Aliarcobacter]|uniref:helix-turn-helix domain-containing protein n=1 Tax=Aliarcobacter TaxID=2321111 RepID=UPI0021B1C3CC|nr:MULTISPECIES: helix-turn-helix domain-containing protein [Aliarcobacter]MCT7473658.1 helix-turn-helix domain-containing protein [Aliarcobacter cryaerophilus]MCT7482118.1 helix-turn-helix domain-containing protein [Aliarcobacter cryaerophilus]MCT7602149.1 helix-turn-helix domain-containing protein [Aliarcobacter butzleri]